MINILFGLIGFIAGLAFSLGIAAPPFWQWVLGLFVVGPLVGSAGGFVGSLIDIWIEDRTSP